MAFFIAIFAWLLVPLFWAASICEFFFVFRRCQVLAQKRAAISIISAQLVAPFLYFLLYRVMPGTDWHAEPVGMSEITGNTITVTAIVCLALMLASVIIILRAQPLPKNET